MTGPARPAQVTRDVIRRTGCCPQGIPAGAQSLRGPVVHTLGTPFGRPQTRPRPPRPPGTPVQRGSMTHLLAPILLSPVLSLLLLTGGAAGSASLASAPLWDWPVEGGREVSRGFDPHTQFGPGHRGIDIPASAGTPVRAVSDGIVTFTGTVAGRPVLTVIHPPTGIRTTVEPVDATVAIGDDVRRGAIIGVVATGGHCALRCLHLGMRRGDRYLHPLTVLRRAAVLKPSGTGVRLVEGRSQALDRYVRVALGRGQGGVAEHLLHRPEIGAALEHVGGRGVAHPMRRDVRHACR